MVHNSQPSDDNQTPFTSLIGMRKAHLELMEQSLSKEHDSSSKFVDSILNFIERGRTTGVLLGEEEDRSNAQKLLNYWSNELIHLDALQDQWLNSILADYDLNKAPELDEKDCPYPGLKVFEEADHDLFVGRTNLIETLLKKLQSQKLLVVVGPPNSGKSSLVLAGLLPELKARKLDHSENWCYLKPTTPGSYLPDKSNKLSIEGIELEQLKPDRDKTCTTVLVIDQFEDLFILDIEQQIRRKFAQNLLKLFKHQNIKIILTIRQDFQTDFEKLLPSFKKDGEYYVKVEPFTSRELKEAIEIPAKRKGLQFEGNIVNELVRDLEAEAMPLPLLQFVLMKLWKKREKNLITYNIYHEVTRTPKLSDQSGVYRALSHTACVFYEKSSPEEQKTVERIFLQLLQPSIDTEAKSLRLERKALYQESEDKEKTDRVIDNLIKENLLRLTRGATSDDDQLEVVHPSLADSWPLLKKLLIEKRRLMQDVSLDARQWDKQKSNSELLLRGKQLDKALQLIKSVETSKTLTSLDKEFINKSLRQRNINLRIWTAIWGIIGLVIIVLSFFVYYAKEKEKSDLRIKELENSLKIANNRLTIANERREYAENLLESYSQSIQETKKIRIDAERLLQAAEKNQENVNTQLNLAQITLNKAEDARRDVEQKSDEFWWGMLTGLGTMFFILFFWEVFSPRRLR